MVAADMRGRHGGMFLLELDEGVSDQSGVPDWSGEFEVTGRSTAIMRVHGSDERQHFAPAGWLATGHSTFPDGSLEVYTFVRIPHAHVHLVCDECGV